jgi:hypothetical protein
MTKKESPSKVIKSIFMSLIIAFVIYMFIITTLINPYIQEEHGRPLAIFEEYKKNTFSNSVIIIGDSMVREGFNSKIIEDTLYNSTKKRVNVFNLGIGGDSPLRRLIELKQILKSEPLLVIIGISPLSFSNLTKIPDDNLILLSGEIDLEVEELNFYSDREKKMMSYNFFQRELDKRKYLKSTIESYFKPVDFSPNMINPFQIAEVVGREKTLEILKEKDFEEMKRIIIQFNEQQKEKTNNFKNPYKYASLRLSTHESSEVNPNFVKKFELSDLKIRKSQKEALIYLIKNLNQQEIPTIVINMPVNKLMVKEFSEDSQQYYKKIIEEEIIPTTTYLDFSNIYSKYEFGDFTHLNKYGRASFSETIAHIISN